MSELWSIYIGGMDEYHAAPSEAVAKQMVEKHNAAIKNWYEATPATSVARPPLEVALARVEKWPFDAEFHAEDLADFDYVQWGVEPEASS